MMQDSLFCHRYIFFIKHNELEVILTENSVTLTKLHIEEKKPYNE